MSTAPDNTLLQKAFIESSVEKLPPHKAIMILEESSCKSAIELMISEKIGCLLVKNTNQTLSGIFTERDVLLKLSSNKSNLADIPVSKMMTATPQTLKYHASIAKAIYLMSVGGFRHIPIILRDGSFSIISVTDFIRYIFLKINKRMEKQEEASEVIKLENSVDAFFEGDLSALKPSNVSIVTPTTPTNQAVSTMVKNKAGCIIVGNINNKSVLGLFTERDLIKRYILNRDKFSEVPISEIMTKNPITLQPNSSVIYALDAMTQGKFRHIPVVDYEEKLIGTLSVKNFLKFLGAGIINDLNKK
jgi:CBS domain-containing protein